MGIRDTLRELDKGAERRFTEREVGFVAGRVSDVERRLRALEDTTKAQARAIAVLQARLADRPG